MQVLRRCGDVYGSKCRIPRLAYMVLSHLCYAQGRLEEALEATKMASESNARMQGPDYGVKLIELEKRLRHITREMDQLRKSGGEDFPRMNSPQRDLSEVAGHVDSDLDLLSNNRDSTFSNPRP